ncbi:prepilin-type N-terminal cleavage/methylation domain-containing protein [Kordiimonas gwangyangensis]|uniref:prepilin-type N-terminal cleavage/methylation domain-containing protein n=1 Tax=Kordiimonas gwangyangensis TaxID=288022 RepID=UPI0003704AB6|nr:prepilin-type N-terminal cleavage/methylation domain-containing protein [Kordiimonas gwangyangensis]
MRALSSDKGFSLVEIMVVMAIMGLMASAVVLAMPSKDDRLERALSGTRSYMTALGRTAVTTGRAVGLRFDDSGYTPLVLKGGVWVADSTLVGRARTWDGASLVGVELDGAAVSLELKRGEVLRPHVWFLPTGEAASFKLSLEVEGERGSVQGSGTGAIEVVAHAS